MPTIYTEDVQSYHVTLSFYAGSGRTDIIITPTPDFHGRVHNVHLNIYPAVPTDVAGAIVGSDSFTYDYWVGSNTVGMGTSVLSVLERPGPKHMSILADSAIPTSGGSFSIPIRQFHISTESLSSQISRLQRQQIPEEFRKLLPSEFLTALTLVAT